MIPRRRNDIGHIWTGVVDTGCYLSVVPERIAAHFVPGVVTPLPFDPSMPAGLRTVSIGGGTYPYDLGEIRLRLRDQDRRSLDVFLVAQFTRDGGVSSLPLILGLRGGLLDGRTLRAEPDAAAPFGQGWWLED